MPHWGYEGSELPPGRWYEECSIAETGRKQSPINILTSHAKHSHKDPLSMNYSANAVTSVKNNGHSVVFATDGGSNVLSGGPLKSKYTLAQFHFHWGKDSYAEGSEHAVDGNKFSGEMHFVHWNSEKYASLTEAVKHPDGLCVVGTFLQRGHHDDPHFQPVLDNIKHVIFKGNTHDITHGFNPESLLPKDRSCYYTYQGSLTTPECQECVTWIVFKDPVLLSEYQLNEFRKLHFGEDHRSPYMQNNFRPVQDLNDRVIEYQD